MNHRGNTTNSETLHQKIQKPIEEILYYGGIKKLFDKSLNGLIKYKILIIRK